MFSPPEVTSAATFPVSNSKETLLSGFRFLSSSLCPSDIWSFINHVSLLFCIVLVVQLLSHVDLSRPHELHHARLPDLCYLLEFTQTHVHWMVPSNCLILCCLLLLLPSTITSIRVFSSKSILCIRWPKYWSFSVNPSSEYWGLILFGIDLFDLLAVQRTLKSLLQHHSLKASIHVIML